MLFSLVSQWQNQAKMQRNRYSSDRQHQEFVPIHLHGSAMLWFVAPDGPLLSTVCTWRGPSQQPAKPFQDSQKSKVSNLDFEQVEMLANLSDYAADYPEMPFEEIVTRLAVDFPKANNGKTWEQECRDVFELERDEELSPLRMVL